VSAVPPTFTIAIAAYNRGPAIARTLDSVLAQTLPALEVVVVDDGSADDTVDFVRRHYPQVRLVPIAHGGQSVARNRGAEEARGDVVVHFDSDDVMMPHALATFADLFRTFPEARAAFADHRYENSITGTVWENHHRTQPQFARMWSTRPVRTVGDSRLYDRRLYYPMLHGGLLQQPWAVYRSTFLESGGFVPGLRSNEDWDLFLRLVYRHPVALTDRVISTHLLEKDRDHVSLSSGQDETNMAVIRRHLQFRRWSDPWASAILRRRLGLYLKSHGDQARPTDLGRAWKMYWRSFCTWPFDPVVAARALCLWPLRLLFGRHPNPVAPNAVSPCAVPTLASAEPPQATAAVRGL
jgi:glycosyltransferase involved in cell wall biosynthesis